MLYWRLDTHIVFWIVSYLNAGSLTKTCKSFTYINTIGRLNHRVKAFENLFEACQLIEKPTNFRRTIPSSLVEIVRSDDNALSQL